jgi:hypothetical protein
MNFKIKTTNGLMEPVININSHGAQGYRRYLTILEGSNGQGCCCGNSYRLNCGNCNGLRKDTSGGENASKNFHEASTEEKKSCRNSITYDMNTAGKHA